jgi:hypothetical protein
MQAYVVRENDLHASIELQTKSRHQFYTYSLWRARSGEYLFDGVAEDLKDALETLRAHVGYLRGQGGSESRE